MMAKSKNRSRVQLQFLGVTNGWLLRCISLSERQHTLSKYKNARIKKRLEALSNQPFYHP